jgi:DNA recombination protein RmuC
VLVATRRFDDLGVAAAPVPRPGPVEGTVRTLRSVPDGDADRSTAEPTLPGLGAGAGLPGAGLPGPDSASSDRPAAGFPGAGRHTAERDGTTG